MVYQVDNGVAAVANAWAGERWAGRLLRQSFYAPVALEGGRAHLVYSQAALHWMDPAWGLVSMAHSWRVTPETAALTERALGALLDALGPGVAPRHVLAASFLGIAETATHSPAMRNVCQRFSSAFEEALGKEKGAAMSLTIQVPLHLARVRPILVRIRDDARTNCVSLISFRRPAVDIVSWTKGKCRRRHKSCRQCAKRLWPSRLRSGLFCSFPFGAIGWSK